MKASANALWEEHREVSQKRRSGDVGGGFAGAGVANVEATDPEDDVLGDVGGVVADALEVAAR